MQSAFFSCVLNLILLLEFYCIVPKGGNVETYYKPTNNIELKKENIHLIYSRYYCIGLCLFNSTGK